MHLLTVFVTSAVIQQRLQNIYIIQFFQELLGAGQKRSMKPNISLNYFPYLHQLPYEKGNPKNVQNGFIMRIFVGHYEPILDIFLISFFIGYIRFSKPNP